MKKAAHIILKVVFTLILALPIIGATGVLGEATRDFYNTDLAFSFIEIMNEVGYITTMMVVVHIVAIIALWTRREALAAILAAPITANVVAFHWAIDGGAFTSGALLGNIMLLINIYLLWKYKDTYRSLTQKR